MNNVVVISGASDGLGICFAKRLSQNNKPWDYSPSENKVIILSPHVAKLKKVSRELECEYFVCDVSKYDHDEKVVYKVIEKHGRIDVLINNAGLWIEDELEINDPKRIRKVVEVNTLGAIFLTKATIPTMKKQKKGLIINVISQAGLYGKAERSVYNASKFAITGFTKSMELELNKYGIGVTGLYPGKMKTKMFEKMGIKKSMEDALDPMEIAKTIEFILSLDQTTVFPEIGIKHSGYKYK